MHSAALLIGVLLAGCAGQPLSPASCRAHGVKVPDGAAQSGRIAEQYVANMETVKARCQRPFEPVCRGCTLALQPGEYVIWATDDAALTHEKCHALYEVWH